MRNTVVSILITTFCFSAKAQLNFFFNPHVNFKSCFAFVDPASLNNSENNLLENQHFYAPYAVSESHRFIKHPSVNFGFSIGAKYKNNTRLLQLGYDTDGVLFGIETYFRSSNSDIHQGHVINYMGIKIHRLTLGYSLKLSKKESILQSWLTIGAGSYLNFNGFTGTFPAYWDLQVAPNTRLLKTYFQPFEERKINGFVKIGFENDLFFKKKYILSLNISYNQGIGIISRSEFVHEYLIDNILVLNRTGLMSRGSGFYFEISRRFQLYPLKKNKSIE